MARRHDALIPLSHDHQKALMLAFRLLHPAPPGPVTPTTPATTPRSRTDETLAFFAEHLVEHFALEEELLFPALRVVHPEGSTERDVIDQLCREHVQMRELRRLLEHECDDETLDRCLNDFGTLLEKHIRLEERGLFASFPGILDAADVVELQRKIHARRPPDSPGACKI